MIIGGNDFWRGKRILLTGHTGFKGSWLALWLKRLGADVTGIAIQPNTSPSLFELGDIQEGMTSHYCDIRNIKKLQILIDSIQPEIVFHLAAQPLVRASYKDPLDTFSTNIIGTANILDSLRKVESCKVAVMVTTDKVYSNKEWLYPYRESDALGGHDPYSASKAASEIIISSYRDSFLAQQGLAVASARAGNVIGGGDWSQDRLIPDAVRAWQAGTAIEIRNPKATRPWQHVLEPLAGYLTLAYKLWSQPELSGAYNFGPQPHEVASVRKVIELAKLATDGSQIKYVKDSSNLHEASLLALETAKSRAILNFSPQWSLEETVARTMKWYKEQQKGTTAIELCLKEISDYEETL